MIDTATLSRLITVLQTLRDSHETDSGGYEKVWANGTIESLKNLDYWTESPQAVLEARSTLSDLKNVRNVLASLSSSLEESIMGIEEHIRPFERGKGLASIPDEMLSKIFAHAEGRQRRSTTKDKLSLVCRRFRRIVLNTPRLWSHIDSSDKIRYVRTCLERSKSAGLSINLNIHDERSLDRGLSFFAQLIPYSSRWEQLDVYLGITETQNGVDLRGKILQSTISANLHLPALHTLSLNFRQKFFLDAANVRTRHFYQNWDMPNLRFLNTNIVPKNIITPKLSSFRISGGRSPLDKVRLRNFIATVPTVQELYVNLNSDSASSREQDSQQASEVSTTILPNLRILHIYATRCPGTDVHSFMRAFRTPVLHKLAIEISTPRTSYETDTALCVFFPHRNYSTLQDLSIKMHSSLFPPFYFDLPMAKLRGLRSLSLDTKSFVPTVPCYVEDKDGEHEYIPALHTLAIANCDNAHLRWLKQVQTSLLQQKHWAGFKRLEIAAALNFSSVQEINTVYGGEDKDVVWRDTINSPSLFNSSD